MYGYNGVSTRAIASAAQVNEVTVFRHYPSKRDLSLAVMKSGLKQLRPSGDLLAGIAEARDGQTALLRTFELITKTLMEKTEIVRLLQYSALDLSTEFDPLVRVQLAEFVDLTASYLEPWTKIGELRCTDSKTLIFTFIAIVISYGSLQRVFQGEELGPDRMLEVCMDLCLR
jgi:AcrR family transcriptional regulator